MGDSARGRERRTGSGSGSAAALNEKVQIFRIASALDPDAQGGDAAFRKFVNESYHIENEYVMQLNPRDFDAVPEHVVQLCSELLS